MADQPTPPRVFVAISFFLSAGRSRSSKVYSESLLGARGRANYGPGSVNLFAFHEKNFISDRLFEDRQ